MSFLYIGLMSGTSVDGIDAVVCEIGANHCKLVSSLSTPLKPSLQAKIHQLSNAEYDGDPIEQLGQLDTELGQTFANAVKQLLNHAKLKASDIKAIGSHGQTVRHHPQLEHPFTLQIGDANIIAAETGITTVADFRRRDVALGGQGAPLVPAFHQAVFSQADTTRIILNLGGIANITVLNPEQEVIGFDTGPANTLMDQWIYKHHQKTFDKDGEWAQSGQIQQGLLNKMLTEPYFQQAAPKSTGREAFNLNWLESLVTDESPQDVQRCLLELTAISVCDAIKAQANQGELYICGGGAHNAFLINRIKALSPSWKVSTTSELGVEPDWVEGMAFAWLAYRTMHNLSGNLAAVTGASKNAILGAIYSA